MSCIIALTSIAPGPSTAGAPERSDVRVLIDVSGSMRENDPGNLRRPALRMLSGLLQPGTRAGVWTFARQADRLVPVAEVSADWTRRVRDLSDRIASPGQFTHIEAVLEDASRDWQGEPGAHARHLLLLTDGMVDVSKDPRDSEQSRARILDSVLPRLKTLGVKVHTIALSSRADHELMERLAVETGGWYQQVAEADELQRVFLRMFETVGRPDAVPLEDNRFVVDSSVSEATVLVFTRPDARPVVLRAPSGEAFGDSDLPAGIAWYRDQGYELITIADPQKGEWSLDADVDPDNRVMIVTDLKLETSEVPGHLVVGEPLRAEAFLTSRGKLVDRQVFLRLLEVYAEGVTEEGRVALPLNDAGEAGDQQAADGRYTLQHAEPRAHEAFELLIAVDSATFMRERRLRLGVHEPVAGAVEPGEAGLRLSIRLEESVMQPGASVTAWQQTTEGQRLPLELAETEAGRWSAPLADAVAPSYVEVSGTSRLGNPVERTVGPLMPPGIVPPPQPELPVQDEPPTETAAEVEAPVAPEPAVEAPAAESTPGDWLLPAMVFGGVNLFLLIGGGIWFWLRRRRRDAAPDPDLEDLMVDEPTDAVSGDLEADAEEAA